MTARPAHRTATAVASGVAACLVVLSPSTASGAAADGGAASIEVVVVGDSYVSGEGLPSAEGPCGRTDDAWGVVVGRALGDPAPENLACTGAAVADVTVGAGTAAQVTTASGPADVAVVLVGGNDLGFSELIAGCLDLDEQVDPGAFQGDAEGSAWQDLVGSGRRALGCDVDAEEVLGAIDGFAAGDRFPLPDGATGRLADAHVAIADALLVDGGTLVVATYPSLFDPQDDWAPRYGRRCHGVLEEDADDFVAVTTALDERIRAEAAIAAEALAGRARVVLADVGAVASGDVTTATSSGPHGLCGPGTPWINGLTLVEGGLDQTSLAGAVVGGGQLDLEALGARPTASFHPNTAGHAGIAAAVTEAVTAAGES